MYGHYREATAEDKKDAIEIEEREQGGSQDDVDISGQVCPSHRTISLT